MAAPQLESENAPRGLSAAPGPSGGSRRTIEAEYECQSTLVKLGLRPEVAITLGGRYVIRDLIARGGMAVVYRAYDPSVEREVAIKVVSTTNEDHQRQLRLRAEAWALGRFQHPNVVQVYDVGTSELDEVFMVMEYVAGETLDQWCEREKPERAAILDAYIAAGRGLAAAHKRAILHRDFKPANVLVVAEGGRCTRVRVSDFGLASGEALREVQRRAEPGSEALREGGGTPGYMAPEQLDPERVGEVGPPADQYAFCVAAWMALTGEPPFVGEAILDPEARRQPPPRPKGMPRWIYRALRRGLAHDPARRHPSMAALLAVLDDPPGPKLRRGALLLLGLGLGLVIALSSVRLFDEAEDPCAAVDDELAAVWGPERRAQLHDTLAARDRPGARSQAARVVAAADDFAARWRTGRRTLCEAEAPPAPSDAAAQTHRDALAVFDHQLTFIEDHPFEHSSAGLDALSSRWLLDAPTSLARSPLLPELRQRLVEVEGYRLLGELEQANARLQATQSLAESADPCLPNTEFRAELAATQLQLGRIRLDQGLIAGALRAFERSSEHARACGAAAIEVEALLALAKLRAHEQGEPRGARAALRFADVGLALLERDGPQPSLRYARHMTQGSLELAGREWAAAAASFDLAEQLVADDAPILAARARNARGSAHQRAGEFEAARADYTHARALLSSRAIDARDPALRRQWAYPNYNRCSLAIEELRRAKLRGRGPAYLSARAQCMEAAATTTAQLRLAVEIERLRLDVVTLPKDPAPALLAELELSYRARRLAHDARSLPVASPRHRAMALYWAGRTLDYLDDPDRVYPLSESAGMWERLGEGGMIEASQLLLAETQFEIGDFERARLSYARLRDSHGADTWVFAKAQARLDAIADATR